MSVRIATAMTDIFAQLHEILAKRVMVLDGAMGTEIQTYKLESKDYIGTHSVGRLVNRSRSSSSRVVAGTPLPWYSYSCTGTKNAVRDRSRKDSGLTHCFR